MDDRLSAVARMPASQSDVTCKKQFILYFSKENETCADIFSYITCFCYALEGNLFMSSVLECLGLRYFISFCNVAHYKR
jgi:hypothetical protein